MTGIGRVGWRTYTPINNPLWDNLVAYYTGDNTPNDAKGTYNGTLVNGATYSTGKINNGFSFDGINDYISTSTTSIIDCSLAHTFACWVKPSAVSSTKFFMSFGAGSYGSSIGFTNGGVLTFFAGAVNAQLGSGFILPLNTWTHVSVVYKGAAFGANNVLFYVNGSLVYTGSLYQPSYIWRLHLGSCVGGGAQLYNGMLDECGVWNRIITASEVTELYNGGAGKQYVAPVEASIVSSGLIMNLDAKNALSYPGTGTVWTDLSGNGNNGTLYNGTSYNASNGGTMVFDGINDYIKIPTGLPTSNTLSVWFKQPAPTGGGLLETNTLTGLGGGSSQLFVGLGSNYLRTYGEPYGYSPNSAYTPTNWYNVTITGSSAVRNIYMNGVLTATKSNIPNYGANAAINIGVGYPGYFNGNVPVVHLYNRVLTQAEITANFNALKGRYGL
jgi:hypothetical protein